MAWKIELSGLAQRNLKNLDRQVAKRILVFLHGGLGRLDDPRSIGQALKGSDLGQFWKYRVGDWRIIASMEDRDIRILVVRIVNRREVYR
jgi:mRNA interferase RelE/StbE